MKRLHDCQGTFVTNGAGEVPFVARCDNEHTLTCTCFADALRHARELESARPDGAPRLGWVVVRIRDGAVLSAERMYKTGKHPTLPLMSSRAKLGNAASNRVQRAKRRAA